MTQARQPVIEPVIEARQLTKRYGSARGVDDITFTVGHGEAFGFLGPNGAGKTTTIRVVLDLIRPTRGTVRVFGLDPRRRSLDVRRRVGYLPGELSLYERMTVRSFLEAFADLRGGVEPARVGSLVDRFDLDLSKTIRDLSHGNKQKVGLVQAFMHRPDLLILDEPTQGLDPLIQRSFHDLIDEEVRERGATVFLSSHVLSEVERLCHRVGIVRQGRLVTVADIEELKSKALRRIEFRFTDQVPASAFQQVPSVRGTSVHGDALTVTVEGSMDEVIKEAARHTVVSVQTHQPSLEEAFLAFYSGEQRSVPTTHPTDA